MSQAPQRSRRTNWAGRAACGGVVGVTVIVAATLGPRVAHLLALTRPRTVTLTELQTLTGLRFPPATELVYSHYEQMPRAWLKAKLYLHAQDVPEFVERASGPGTWYHDSFLESTLRAYGMWETLPGKTEVLTLDLPAPRVTLAPQAQRLKVLDLVLARPTSGRAVVYLIGSGD